MTQTIFNFNKEPLLEQLELFSNNIYDNRISRLKYALKISHDLHGWSPYNLDNLKECGKLFKVSCEEVINQYYKLYRY